jgi:GntR family transcriptional regulator/GntR family frlABCD operon transcriptional regulator
MEDPLYRKLQNDIKSQILSGIYKEGDLLPSEHELMAVHNVTRSTVRQALDELVKEGYIIKMQGKGSVVTKRQRRTLGLLTVKGFSEAVSETKEKVNTVILKKPSLMKWEESFYYNISDLERKAGCIYLNRLRCVGEEPVMLENTYIANLNLPRFCSNPFVRGSLFETLNQNYHIEITDVDQDLRAVIANKEIAGFLNIKEKSPLLQIHLKFHTNRDHLFIYSFLHCTTGKYAIGNRL